MVTLETEIMVILQKFTGEPRSLRLPRRIPGRPPEVFHYRRTPQKPGLYRSRYHTLFVDDERSVVDSGAEDRSCVKAARESKEAKASENAGRSLIDLCARGPNGWRRDGCWRNGQGHRDRVRRSCVRRDGRGSRLPWGRAGFG